MVNMKNISSRRRGDPIQRKDLTERNNNKESITPKSRKLKESIKIRELSCLISLKVSNLRPKGSKKELARSRLMIKN